MSYKMQNQFINNCRQLYNMKSLKSQPTSYKDFVQQIGKVKDQKKVNQYKIKQTPKGSNSNTVSMHSQSTSMWDKRSPSQNRLMTEVSAEKKIKSHNQSIQESRTPTLSHKDKIMCYHKFISEASAILTNLFKIPVPDLLTNRISYIQYLQALKALKMIYQSYEPYPNDLVSQLWCEYISGQNIGNFLIIVSSILGMHQSKLSEQDKYLKNKYQSLRFTRMELNKSTSHENYQENQCTFMPQISDRSRKLAESASKSKSKCKKSSRKALQSINTEKSLTERLNVQYANHQRSKASIDYDQDYNFYASTTEPTVKKIDIAGNKRSQLLYEKAKQKSCQKRQNKTSNDIQFEKSKNQLTFKPTILKVKSKQQIGNKCAVKGQKNTISRMIRGRVERQVRRIINEKGVPYNQKFVDKMRKQRYQQISIYTNFSSIEKTPSSVEPSATPINRIQKSGNPTEPKIEPFVRSNLSIPQQDLVIDVYLSEDHKQKLMIKKGQNIDDVAGKFIEQHGISQDKKEQLIQLLELSISHALCPIDELVEEQDELASARTHYKRQYCR